MAVVMTCSVAVHQVMIKRSRVLSLISSNRWKVHEAAMFAIGSVCSLIIEHVQENKLQFDMQHFLQSVVLDDLNQNG